MGKNIQKTEQTKANLSNKKTTAMQRLTYEKYKLDWLIEHNFTINDLILGIASYIADSCEDISLEKAFSEWETNVGFDGKIYPCFAEFCENEYFDRSLMEALLDFKQFDEYDKEFWAQ